MTTPWSITITPVPGSEDCVIETSDGQKFVVRGLALFADGGEGQLFTYWWNSPAMAACGCVRAFAEAIRREDPFALTFYKKILQGMVKVTGVRAFNEITQEEALRKFESQEIYDAVKTDRGKFN